MTYQYVQSTNRYRDIKTGRYVSRDKVLAYVQGIVNEKGNTGQTLADQLTGGVISPDDYGKLLKQNLKDSYVQQMILGRGGRSQVTKSDWGVVGRGLKPRYAEIDNYVTEIKTRISEDNPFSADYLANRNRLYFEQSRTMYERGNSAAYGTPNLPAYPGDLSTRCQSGCKCSWRIVKIRGIGFDCFWELKPGENCKDCKERARKWNPLKIRNGKIINAEIAGDLHALEKLLSYEEISRALS